MKRGFYDAIKVAETLDDWSAIEPIGWTTPADTGTIVIPATISEFLPRLFIQLIDAAE